jgi:chitodextrinase
VAGIVVALGLVAFLLAPAEAEVGSIGEATWGVYGLDTDTETDSIQSHVWAIEQIGNTVYVGGKFLEARPSASGTPVARPYLAAFDATTGDLITSFTPNLESAVYALEAAPDGSRLFVGGEFRSINGDTAAHGLAALDPVTGAVDTTWRGKVSNASGARPIVYSLTTSGDQLYASGRFDRIGGTDRPLHLTDKVGRVSVADGTPDTSFTTTITGGSVWGVAAAPDGSKVYLAGHHDTVDGDSAGADYAVLDSTGTLIPSFSDHGGNSSRTSRWYGQDVVAVGDLVFWAGSEHIVRVFSATTGALITEHSTDRGGDYQDLEVVGDRVYASCHCYTNHYADFDWWKYGAVILPTVEVTPIHYVAAYSATTGAHIPSFSLDASATRAGVWAIHGAPDGCLWVGGDISRVTTVDGKDRAAGGFAKFCDADGTDRRAPTAPTELFQTRAEDHKIVLRWDASTDNLGVDHYEISRDGEVVGTKDDTGAGQYWFTDAELTAGTEYAYEVVAIDAAGNRSEASTVAAVTTGVAPGGDSEAPTTPANLTQTRTESAKIVIRWDRSTDNVGVDHYEISRDGSVVATKTSGSSSQYWLTDGGLSPATNYLYEVVAIDAAGNRSAPASLTAGTTGAPSDEPPDAPTGLRSTRQTKERIVLNWTASIGAASYVIERDSGAGFQEVGTRTGVWFTDLGLPADTSFAYRVIAVDGEGTRSAPSTQLVVATLP